MRRHLLEVMKHYVLEVLKIDGNSIDDIETKLCEGRSGVGFDRAPKLPVQPIKPPIHGVRLLHPLSRWVGRETDHCHNLLARLRISGAISILPYAFMKCTGRILTVSNQTTYIFSRRRSQRSKSTQHLEWAVSKRKYILNSEFCLLRCMRTVRI